MRSLRNVKIIQDKKSRTITEQPWCFELYVAGMNPRAITTLSNLKNFCVEYFGDNFEIKLIDLAVEPHLAQKNQIFAIPTLIKVSPEPICRSIGDLSNISNLILQLNLKTDK